MKKEAMLYEKLAGGGVHCLLCAQDCKIADSGYGFCGVRKNENGTLYSCVYGEIIASHVDPIEKKPLYHFFPGTKAYSVATVGCNFKCGFCQNWQISQSTKRDAASRAGYEMSPEGAVREAKKYKCKSISYTYTEPTVFFEFAYDTAKLAKEENIYNTFVTNGYMTKKALDIIKPYLDACNVDLKSFSDKTYKEISQGSLEPVLESIRHMKKIGIWTEVTTLVVPGMNDSDGELGSIAEFIAGVGEDIPWHISRFHPDYNYTDAHPTPLVTLKRAESIGKKAGLRYVYLGNVMEDTNTYCHKCGSLLIERSGYAVAKRGMRDGKCASCGAGVAGVW